MFHKFKNATTAAAVGITSMVAAGSAAAQSTGSFDNGDILAKVTEYGASAVAIVAAILLVRWGLHAMGVLRPRG